MSSENFSKTTTVTLELDEDDIRDFRAAAKERLSWAIDGKMALPDGGGNLEGRAMGEICRGWLESLGTFSGTFSGLDSLTLEVKDNEGPENDAMVRSI